MNWNNVQIVPTFVDQGYPAINWRTEILKMNIILYQKRRHGNY